MARKLIKRQNLNELRASKLINKFLNKATSNIWPNVFFLYRIVMFVIYDAEDQLKAICLNLKKGNVTMKNYPQYSIIFI